MSHLNDELQLIKVKCKIQLLFLAYANQTLGKRLETKALTCRTIAARVQLKIFVYFSAVPCKTAREIAGGTIQVLLGLNAKDDG